MKIRAICLLAFFIGACSMTVSAASPKSKPKSYTATTLPDGRIEITVSSKAGLPSGSEVLVINLREKLEAAAAQQCPGGYDLETDNSSRIGAAPNGQGLVARQKGVVQCK